MSQNRTTRHAGLARALSKMGYCSRAAARELIARGQVCVDGRVVLDPEKPVALGRVHIEVAGEQVKSVKPTYVMINKPRGLVSTASDEKGRDTVYSLLPKYRHWLAPVGRLDKASEGLLLMTNDSEWGARITDPNSHLDKTYHVQISAVADDKLIQRLASGINDGGECLRAKRVTLLRTGEKNCWLEIVLDEGKNRQIRRMLSVLGIEVLRLVRVAIGPLMLGNLAKGASRELSGEEIRSMKRAVFPRQNFPTD